MHGKKMPAGIMAPDVMHVNKYQIQMKMPAFFVKISLWLIINVLMVLAYESKRRVANLSNLPSSLQRN